MGYEKYKTLDCESCEWYRTREGEEFCVWGVFQKRLVQREKPRRCEVKNRERKDTYHFNNYHLEGLTIKQRINQIKETSKQNDLG